MPHLMTSESASSSQILPCTTFPRAEMTPRWLSLGPGCWTELFFVCLNSLLVTLWVAFCIVNYVLIPWTPLLTIMLATQEWGGTLPSFSLLHLRALEGQGMCWVSQPYRVACFHHTHWIGPHCASYWDLVNLISLERTPPWCRCCHHYSISPIQHSKIIAGGSPPDTTPWGLFLSDDHSGLHNTALKLSNSFNIFIQWAEPRAHFE